MTSNRLVSLAGVFLVGAVILGSVLVFLPYLNPDLPTPTGDPQWRTYRNDRVGYLLEAPIQYEISEEEDVTVFSFEGASLIRVNWTSEEAARSRGLWPKHSPSADVVLDGRPGKKYIYNHFDAVFGVRTVAYVTPHRGRLFGLEFRTARVSIVEDVLGLASRVESQPEEFRVRVVSSLRLEN